MSVWHALKALVTRAQNCMTKNAAGGENAAEVGGAARSVDEGDPSRRIVSDDPERRS